MAKNRTDRTPKAPPAREQQPSTKTPENPRADWQERFLEHLRTTGNVCAAYRKAGLRARSWVYERREQDAGFARQWDEALADWADGLEAEAYRRAVEGTDKPLCYRGEVFTHVKEYSDTLLAMMLKAAKPEKYRERTDVTSGGEQLQQVCVYIPDNQRGGPVTGE
jgi:hypothetical protein